MNINVKKIFMLVMVLGFAGAAFAPRERMAFAPQQPRRESKEVTPKVKKQRVAAKPQMVRR